MKLRHRLSGFSVGLAGAVLGASPALGCAVCFGDSDSAMMQGLTWSIGLLVAVLYGVLFSIVAFFVYIIRRAAALERQELAAQTAGIEAENFTAADHVR